MNNVKYIKIEELENKIKEVLREVLDNDTEYIVMVDKEPKIKISPIDRDDGKELVFEKELSNKKLKKFIR